MTENLITGSNTESENNSANEETSKAKELKVVIKEEVVVEEKNTTSNTVTVDSVNSHNNNGNTHNTNSSTALNDDTYAVDITQTVGGSNVRRYLNETITPTLLKGVRLVAQQQPSDPLRFLGEYLINESEIIGKK
ncbi:Sdc1p SCDLUD_004906 [Saccharomycodes ludwigii]|uniref:Sdc1p n=1 Tax=Saccharomycodes ludwigii TaxID=36035 RepID=UPI001E8A7249|nr:hypothetical protein SCDLUD_004906 [Saccharomycodes ludwigii]KAH3899462.1 hypothetical protein SCDLUD_004906 [Saccharomycodes ludwigii]